MQNPTEMTALRDFGEWKEKCDVKGQPFCSLPNPCPLSTRELPGTTHRYDDDDDDDSDDDNDNDFQPPHLHGVPQQLPLDPRPNRRRLQLLNCAYLSPQVKT